MKNIVKTSVHPAYLKAKAGEYLHVAELAALIRSALKRKFPAVKFSVRSESYSGGSSVRVAWTDGPTAKAVDQIAQRYSTRGFDGMIDMAYSKTLWLAPDGSATLAHREGTEGSRGTVPEVIGSAHHPDAVLAKSTDSYISTARTISADLYNRAIAEIKAQNWVELETVDWSAIYAEPQPENRYVLSVLHCPHTLSLGSRWLRDEISAVAHSLEGTP